jgi:hypothetical protein
MPGIEPGPSSPWPLAILTELSQLQIKDYSMDNSHLFIYDAGIDGTPSAAGFIIVYFQ